MNTLGLSTVATSPPVWSNLPSTKLPTPEHPFESIHINHINIHESVSFLLLKLVIIELIAACGLMTTYFLSTNVDAVQTVFKILGNFVLLLFSIIVSIRTLLVLYVILEWLNNYFEITTSKLIHRRGIFFKKKEEFVYSHLMSLDLKQSTFGKILNYGDIHIYDRYINRDIELVQIHNPKRYFDILKELIPFSDSEQETIKDRLIEEDDMGEDD